MKCKACVSGISPQALKVLNELRSEIIKRVIGPHLHRPRLTSAEFYVQKCDQADAGTHEAFCEVRLSGVSVTADRSKNDFENARAELERIYKEKLGQLVRRDTYLFVVLMLDGVPPGGSSPLIEGEGIIIDSVRDIF